jgi:hypothetical protein
MFFTPSWRRKNKKIRSGQPKLTIPYKIAIFTPGIFLVDTSVVDPDPNPDPPDPHVFGPPGSGFTSQSVDLDPALDPDPSIIVQK